MTGTVTSYAQLNTDMPAGTVGGINAADIQNFLASVMGVIAWVSKTANYTLTESDHYVSVDATAGAVTITLPASASTRVGKRYTVNKIDAGGNAVTVDGNGAETIEGSANVSLATQWSKVTVVNNGTSWVKE